MKKGKWKIQVWNKNQNKLLFQKIEHDKLKPIAMIDAFNEFIFKHAIDNLDDFDSLEFIVMKLE